MSFCLEVFRKAQKSKVLVGPTLLVSYMFKNSLSYTIIIYVTEFGVGLIVEPKGSQQNIDVYNLRYAFFIILSTFCLAWVFWLKVWAGFWQFIFISYTNQEFVTYKRVVSDVISMIWLRCVIFSSVVAWLLSDMYIRVGLFPRGVGLTILV